MAGENSVGEPCATCVLFCLQVFHRSGDGTAETRYPMQILYQPNPQEEALGCE